MPPNRNERQGERKESIDEALPSLPP